MASKGVKIALIGCGALGLICLVAVLAGGYFVKTWFTDKAKSITKVADTEKEYDQRTTELKRDYPFVEPSNGVISESQLNRFLTVRKSMYAVYKQHEGEFKKMEENKEQGFSVLMKATDLIQDVKVAQVKALEDQKMSPDEYSYIVTAVYKSWFAKGAKDSLQQQQSYQEATQESVKKSVAELDQKLQDPNTTDQEKQILMQTKQMLETQMNAIQPGMQQLDNEVQSVPQQNIELFAKHQQEIQQYSMSGLEFMGL